MKIASKTGKIIETTRTIGKKCCFFNNLITTNLTVVKIEYCKKNLKLTTKWPSGEILDSAFFWSLQASVYTSLTHRLVYIKRNGLFNTCLNSRVTKVVINDHMRLGKNKVKDATHKVREVKCKGINVVKLFNKFINGGIEI